MCGIVVIVTSERSEDEVREMLEQSHSVQGHRGPDMVGSLVRTVGDRVVGLAHQRLSIQDLSESGAQPMHSHSGRYTIVFNGEVYNFPELAQEFELFDLRSRTDTEVLLELVESVGIEVALRHANGMWALAIVDWQKNRLFLSRDRAGIKPLHVSATSDELLVTSELKTILALGRGPFNLDLVASRRFLAQHVQHVDQRTFVEEVHSFPSACYSEVSLVGEDLAVPQARPYWTLNPVALEPYQGGRQDFTREFEELLVDACRLRLRSDVPVGLALSGGLDSSVLAGVLSELQSGSKVSAVSAVSPGEPEDESFFIDLISDRLGLELTKVTLLGRERDDFVELLERCTFVNDGPLISFSPVLYFLLMEAVEDAGITVVFSGQGADELLCGYRKYQFFFLQDLLRSGRAWTFLVEGLLALINGRIHRQFNLGEAQRYLPAYIGRRSATMVGDGLDTDLGLGSGGMNARQWSDIRSLSVPVLLHYEDRMSMAHGREVRVPFLDYRLIELALSAPSTIKINRGWTKAPLRQAFSDRLPSEIAWRKEKKGFSNPQDRMLRTAFADELHSLAGNRLAPVFETGLVDPGVYRDLVQRYLAGDSRVTFRSVFGPYALDVWIRVSGVQVPTTS